MVVLKARVAVMSEMRHCSFESVCRGEGVKTMGGCGVAECQPHSCLHVTHTHTHQMQTLSPASLPMNKALQGHKGVCVCACVCVCVCLCAVPGRCGWIIAHLIYYRG